MNPFYISHRIGQPILKRSALAGRRVFRYQSASANRVTATATADPHLLFPLSVPTCAHVSYPA
ncbi:hypothetical protein C1O30_05370 [Dickeya zeae]|nr:hypothetical protein C1O30_05370 [Dickeya zeae]